MQKRRSETTTKVFVGSLPAGTSVEELRQLFSSYGEIAECDVVNRCGFLHLEDKNLAIKAIRDLHNSMFKNSKISVEKGRVKPPPGKSGGGGRGVRSGGGGPMRGGRDSGRSTPYMRDDYNRRGPPPRGDFAGVSGYGGRGDGYGRDDSYGRVDTYGRGDNGYGNRGDNGYGNREDYGGRGYDRGFDSRAMPPARSMPDYGTDRRYMEERRYDDRMYPDGGYMAPETDGRMYRDERSYPDERAARRPLLEDRPMMDERRPLLGTRRPLLEPQINDRRTQPDLYARRDIRDLRDLRDLPPKPLSGAYNDAPRNSYDSSYPPLPSRGYAGGPGPRREMPAARRY